MGSRKITVIVLAVAAATIFHAAAKAPFASANLSPKEGGQKVKRVDEVHVSLICSKTRASLHEGVTLDVAIRNDGPDDIYVFQSMDWGPGCGMDLYIQDQSGKRVGPSRGPLQPPPATDDPTPLVRLGQGFFYGFEGHMQVNDLVPGPGIYTIEVIYQTPFTRELLNDNLRKLPVLTLEDAGLRSNKVRLEVVP